MSDFEVNNTGDSVRLAHAKALLTAAKCPNAHCVDGVCQEGFPDDYRVFQCQWCAEVKELTDG